MIKLYRAVSQAEKDDYDQTKRFNIGINTLEAKQFFKSPVAVRQFVQRSVIQDYDPPYIYLLTITVNTDLLTQANPDDGLLDGFEAITIAEADLNAFNNVLYL